MIDIYILTCLSGLLTFQGRLPHWISAMNGIMCVRDFNGRQIAMRWSARLAKAAKRECEPQWDLTRSMTSKIFAVSTLVLRPHPSRRRNWFTHFLCSFVEILRNYLGMLFMGCPTHSRSYLVPHRYHFPAAMFVNRKVGMRATHPGLRTFFVSGFECFKWNTPGISWQTSFSRCVRVSVQCT